MCTDKLLQPYLQRLKGGKNSGPKHCSHGTVHEHINNALERSGSSKTHRLVQAKDL
jgi:hypothetical protein